MRTEPSVASSMRAAATSARWAVAHFGLGDDGTAFNHYHLARRHNLAWSTTRVDGNFTVSYQGAVTFKVR